MLKSYLRGSRGGELIKENVHVTPLQDKSVPIRPKSAESGNLPCAKTSWYHRVDKAFPRV